MKLDTFFPNPLVTMMLSVGLTALWSLATGAVHAAAASAHGHVFLIDTDTSPSTTHHETIDPPTARLIFAERLGLSRFYDIEDVDEDVIRRINTFGGSHEQPLRRDASSSTPYRVFILVDGLDKPLDLVPSSPHLSFFDIDPAPHPSESSELVSEFLSYHDHIFSPTVVNAPVERAMKPIADLTGMNTIRRGADRTIVHVKSLADVRARMGTSSTECRQQLELLRTAFRQLARLASEESIVATVVMMPSQHDSSKQSGNRYKVKTLLPRSAKVQRQQGESPLEVTPDDTLPQPQNVHDSSPLQAASTLLSGPIQTCFTSRFLCESGTNNCTGHGVCDLKFNTTTGENINYCYGCVCKPVVGTNPDGSSKTTYYGGGACQKIDIVAPFWLLAGTTIFFVSIISFAVGLLYSMGNEELPSVIGAGVSGPRAK